MDIPEGIVSHLRSTSRSSYFLASCLSYILIQIAAACFCADFFPAFGVFSFIKNGTHRPIHSLCFSPFMGVGAGKLAPYIFFLIIISREYLTAGSSTLQVLSSFFKEDIKNFISFPQHKTPLSLAAWDRCWLILPL